MMKHIMTLSIVVAALVASSTAFAGNTSSSTSTSNAQSNSANAGNSQSTYFGASVIPNDTTVRNAPNIGGNGFYGSFAPDACMVSAGVGISVVGLGGQGTTPVRDQQCAVLRGVERTMQVSATMMSTNPVVAKKLQQGAIDMLCNLSPEVGSALKMQGVCTQPPIKPTVTEAAKQSKPVTMSAAEYAARTKANYWGNDQTVLNRLGVR